MSACGKEKGRLCIDKRLKAKRNKGDRGETHIKVKVDGAVGDRKLSSPSVWSYRHAD